MPTAIGVIKGIQLTWFTGEQKGLYNHPVDTDVYSRYELEAMREQALVYEQGGAFTSSASRQVLEFSGMQEVTPVISF